MFPKLICKFTQEIKRDDRLHIDCIRENYRDPPVSVIYYWPITPSTHKTSYAHASSRKLRYPNWHPRANLNINHDVNVKQFSLGVGWESWNPDKIPKKVKTLCLCLSTAHTTGSARAAQKNHKFLLRNRSWRAAAGMGENGISAWVLPSHKAWTEHLWRIQKERKKHAEFLLSSVGCTVNPLHHSRLSILWYVSRNYD